MWVLSIVFAVTTAACLLRYYAEPSTRLYIKVLVSFSWSLGFWFFYALPFDIENAFCRQCRAAATATADCRCLPSPGIDVLPDLVSVAYWLSMLLGYLMNDLLRAYINSGEFTRRGRMKDARWEAAYFYVPAGLVGIVILFWLMIHDGYPFGVVKVIGRGVVNAVGLFILVAFLGYGLVEVPRELWNKGDTEGQLRYLKFKVAVQSDELQQVSAGRPHPRAARSHST